MFVLVDDVVDEVEPAAGGLSLVVPLVLGEAVEFEVSPLVLVLPLGWLMLPELSGEVVLGVWLVEPVAPTVVEPVPDVLGV